MAALQGRTLLQRLASHSLHHHSQSAAVLHRTRCTRHLQASCLRQLSVLQQHHRAFATDSQQQHTDQHSATSTTGNNHNAADSKQQSTSQQSTPSTQQQQQPSAEQQKLSELEAKVKDLTDQRLRALAETENVRSRSRQDLANARLYAIQGFAKQLLEVCDTMELMLKNAKEHVKPDEPALKSLYDGVEMTNKIMLKVLEGQGMKRMSSMGEKFDPYKHEVLFQVEDASKEPNTIAQVMREGYQLHDRTLRAAQVGTVKKSAPSS